MSAGATAVPAPAGTPPGFTQQVIKNGVGYFENPATGALWNPLTSSALPATKTASPSVTSSVTNAFQNVLPNLGLAGAAASAVTGIGGAVPSALKSGAGALANDVAAPIVNALLADIAPKATKFMLYIVFIFGGVALAGFGLSKMIGVNPITAAARGARKAAVVGAVA
jgi:hypothetical protein